MKLIAVNGPADLADTAASVVLEHLAARPNLVLTTPTGHTPIGLYRHLRAEHAAGRCSFDEATVFMLDEYVDLLTYPNGSFQSFLHEHLGDLVFNGRTTLHVLDPFHHSRDPRDYDRALDHAGGLDLAIVGVGSNGHVGFNEPGASDDQRTHVVTLSAATQAANFPDVDVDARPARAVTLGFADLRRARSILLMVAGESKRETAARLVAGVREETVPVTHLLDHPDLVVLVDRDLLS